MQDGSSGRSAGGDCAFDTLLVMSAIDQAVQLGENDNIHIQAACGCNTERERYKV